MQKQYNHPDSRNPAEGDWVRFYRGGQLIIAEVQYIRDAKHYPYDWELCTDNGAVDLGAVLEMRRNKNDEKGQRNTEIK